MKMPWGKYKGKPIKAIPSGYLFWVLDECNSISNELKSAIKSELRDRLDDDKNEDFSELDDELTKWFRELVLHYHPDRGRGTDAQMAALNDANNRLRKRLGLRHK